VIVTGAAVLALAAAGVTGALALAGRSTPEASPPPTPPPTGAPANPLPGPRGTPERLPGDAGPSSAVSALAQRFSLSVPDPDCVVSEGSGSRGPAIACRRTSSGQRVTSSFQRFPDAARAKLAFKADVAKLGRPRTLKLPPTSYYGDPADQSRPTGTIAAAIKKSGQTLFVLQSGRDVAQFAGPEFQIVEREVVDTELRSSVDVHEVFGAEFDTDQFAACWPNRAMLLADGTHANFDCFLKTRGGMDEEHKIELIQLNRGTGVRGTINAWLRQSGGRVVKEGTWGRRKGDPLGPYVVVDRGRGTPRYEVYWGSKDAKQLMAIVSGNKLAAVERLWTKIV
jgi:hypothetical protein